MARLLFRMRHVPEDEAREVRAILEQNGIEYFETFAGNWGISMPGLWITNRDQYPEARRILDQYQMERSTRIKAEYEHRRRLGETRTMWHSFIEDPLRFLMYMILIGVVLFFSLRFFLRF